MTKKKMRSSRGLSRPDHAGDGQDLRFFDTALYFYFRKKQEAFRAFARFRNELALRAGF